MGGGSYARTSLLLMMRSCCRSASGILPLIDGSNPKVEVKSTTGLASKARSMARALSSRNGGGHTNAEYVSLVS